MRSNADLTLISHLQELIYSCMEDLIREEDPIAVLDFPERRNCGDSAIWVGEMAFLQHRHGKRPAYVARRAEFSVENLERAAPTGPIFIHGGGNFGDVWGGHQDFRERIIELFPQRRIVQFPQSIHYQSLARLERSARIIGQHKDFVLLVRDQESKDLAEQHFDCQVRLCPDMAFCIGPVAAGPASLPVLAMLRQDHEKARDLDRPGDPDVPVEDWITESARRVRLSRSLGAASALLAGKPTEVRLRKLDAAARNRFRRGTRQISRGQAIVTDRLHVHIVSLLLGRPHAVLDNSYGKLRRFMSAFSGGTGLTYEATALDDAIAWARHEADCSPSRISVSEASTRLTKA